MKLLKHLAHTCGRHNSGSVHEGRCFQLRQQRAFWVKWRILPQQVAPPGCWTNLFVFFFLVAASRSGGAQNDATFYKTNCAACHTIGAGPRVGPDLKGVTRRKDRQWLIEFMQDPKKVIDSGDTYAKTLAKNSHGMVMPVVPGVDRDRAEALLKFVDQESGSAQSTSGSTRGEIAPQITAEAISRGKRLLTGSRALANGGPPCISCHTVSDVAAVGGGRLGPDLTPSVERLGGAGSMAAWLGSPPTPTMRAAYNGHALRDDEIRELVAYFESAGSRSKARAAANEKWAASFPVIGVLVGLAMLGLMELFWRNRFRAVRRPLVAKREQKSW